MQNQQYITLAKLPPQQGSTPPGASDLTQIVEKHQGRVITHLGGTLGRYDYAFVNEFPSQTEAQAFALELRMGWGLVTETITGSPVSQFEKEVISQTRAVAGNSSRK